GVPLRVHVREAFLPGDHPQQRLGQCLQGLPLIPALCDDLLGVFHELLNGVYGNHALSSRYVVACSDCRTRRGAPQPAMEHPGLLARLRSMRLSVLLPAIAALFAVACSSGGTGPELRDAPITSAEVVSVDGMPPAYDLQVVAQIPGS